MRFSSDQLVARQPAILWHYESMMYTLLITQYDVCAALCSDQAPSDEAQLYYSFIDEIYPNFYPSMDSAINLLLYTGSGSREVLIEAEITGFSQQYFQMVTVTPEIRFFQIKPPVLPDVPSLSGEKTTQIVLKVTDQETGAILAAESRNVTLRSLYDFSMYNNEFGMIEPTPCWRGWIRNPRRCSISGATPSTGSIPPSAKAARACPAISWPTLPKSLSRKPRSFRRWAFREPSASGACAITWGRIPSARISACCRRPRCFPAAPASALKRRCWWSPRCNRPI